MTTIYVPVYIICYENYFFVSNTIEQLNKLRLIEQDNCLYKIGTIIIFDNKSTSRETIDYLHNFPSQTSHDSYDDIVVYYSDKNLGPRIIECKHIYFPKIFIITDPDLQFNYNLPYNWLDIMINIGLSTGIPKVGFALSLNDEEHYGPLSQHIYIYGKTIREWESQFWKTKIKNNISDDDTYKAGIDTTFAVYNNTRSATHSVAIRIAGRFTAIHIPWYPFFMHTTYDKKLIDTAFNKDNKWSTSKKLLN